MTLYVPGTELADVTVMVEFPAPPGASVTVEGLKLVEGPVGEIRAARPTEPENPLRLANVIVDVPDDPRTIESEVGLADTLKSGAGETS